MPVDLPDERFTGENAFINIPNNNEIAVSNVSWDADVNTTEVQHNDDLRATIAVTGLRYSGSFEYDGKNEDLREKLYQDDGRPKRVTMTVKEERGEANLDEGDSPVGTTDRPTELQRTWTFENVIVTGMSRDIPADDVASTSWDFVAEDMVVNES